MHIARASTSVISRRALFMEKVTLEMESGEVCVMYMLYQNKLAYKPIVTVNKTKKKQRFCNM